MALRRRRALALVSLLLVSYVVGSVWLAEVLITPERRLPRPEPGLEPTDVTLLTSDGLTLAAWLVEPVLPARATVLLFHGKDGCRQANRLAWLAAQGYRGLAVDARAHGASEGEYTSFGWHERRDVAAAVAWARATWPGTALVLWGTSQGAAAAVCWLGDVAGQEPLPDGAILESLYPDIDTALRRRVERRLGSSASALALPALALTRATALLRLALDADALDMVARLSELPPLPLLLGTGGLDDYAPPEDLARLAAAAPWAVSALAPGRGHGDLLRDEQGPWALAVASFLEAVSLGAPPAEEEPADARRAGEATASGGRSGR